MRFKPNSLSLGVRPNDLDSLGHVNNAVALEYLEAGRWAWMDQQRISRGGAVVPVVTRIELDYRREIPPPRLIVETILDQPADDDWDEESIAYRARFQQRLLCHEGAHVAVSALVEVAFLDGVTRGLASLQDFLAVSRSI